LDYSDWVCILHSEGHKLFIRIITFKEVRYNVCVQYTLVSQTDIWTLYHSITT